MAEIRCFLLILANGPTIGRFEKTVVFCPILKNKIGHPCFRAMTFYEQSPEAKKKVSEKTSRLERLFLAMTNCSQFKSSNQSKNARVLAKGSKDINKLKINNTSKQAKSHGLRCHPGNMENLLYFVPKWKTQNLSPRVSWQVV